MAVKVRSQFTPHLPGSFVSHAPIQQGNTLDRGEVANLATRLVTSPLSRMSPCLFGSFKVRIAKVLGSCLYPKKGGPGNWEQGEQGGGGFFY